MTLNRRNTVRILASVGLAPQLGFAQAAPENPRAASSPADRAVQAARAGLAADALRIASVKLPRSAEPAFRFRA